MDVSSALCWASQTLNQIIMEDAPLCSELHLPLNTCLNAAALYRKPSVISRGKSNLPDPSKIPSPAYLIVGYNPSDQDTNGRLFNNNKEYYFYDIQDIPQMDRYIRGDFTDMSPANWNPLLLLYCKKFDKIIFDYSVAKFLGPAAIEQTSGYSAIKCFYNMLKVGGQLIIDNEFPLTGIIGEFKNAAKRQKYYVDTVLQFLDRLSKIEFAKVERKNMRRFIEEPQNIIAKSVYDPLYNSFKAKRDRDNVSALEKINLVVLTRTR